MSVVTDISALVAMESQAPAPEANIGIPEVPEVKAPSEPKEATDAPVTEKEKENSEVKPDGAKAEPKALPSQKAIHESLQAFFKEATHEPSLRCEYLKNWSPSEEGYPEFH